MVDAKFIPTADGNTPDVRKALLQEAQKQHIKNNPVSFDLYKSGLAHMPGANTRSVLHVQPFPITIARGESAKLVDVDGHKYLDFLGEFSAGVYGHSSPVIKKAIIDALNKGWNFGGKNEYEAMLAKILVDRFSYSMDSIRFCNSGTEANLMALGAAVNFTRKQKILAFQNSYHGSTLTFFAHESKYTLNSYKDFVVAPYNDISETQAMVSNLPPESLAAIIVEPMQVSGGCIPGTSEFLKLLRDLATKHKAVLIFDEVMTSRLHYGGLQVKHDIKPDMTTIGKWAGGGMSFGAFGGRHEIMQLFDPRENKLAHAGTFNNNVVTMAAGIAGCTILDEALASSLNERGDRLRHEIAELIQKRLPVMYKPGYVGNIMATRGLGSLFVIGFVGPESSSLQALLYHHLLEQGIFIAARGFLALTIEITDQHFQPLLSALDGFIDRYKGALN
ncbi:uncharacterized protein A1O9_03124 [Exophiala aquamarina CBS 119918]|uniref:Glutamate-1-semialdehyde 2,1-aminomutase n=1 Tax=Exophiala aquamarina CBS 119918 TaxID=1182545 RepID=A0A072PP80_9EURO|nr:uncharacterized protein A1O9_03124 [Exophiala aquamarina CBS 119918]KEF61557.1 hypothetical protein A1O9_03124 [Exophiala aquamarina CBS 119918]